MGSSISISVSTSHPIGGEEVNFSLEYEYDKKEDEELRFEIRAARDGELPYLSRVLDHIIRRVSISFTCPHYSCDLVTRIYLADRKSSAVLKILAEKVLAVEAREIIYNVQSLIVRENDVMMKLVSPAYCGCAQIIEFTKSGGVGGGDYVEFYLNGKREGWEWCTSKSSINFGVKNVSARANVSVKYLVKGGTFVAGSKVAELKYELLNPVEVFRVSSRAVEIGKEVAISYRLAYLPPCCTCIVRYQGIRLYSELLTQLSGECTVQCPRLPGECEVACIATADGSTTMASEKIAIIDPQNKAADIRLWFNGLSTEQKIHVVRPNVALTLCAKGEILNSQDEVLILGKGEIFIAPTLTALQMPSLRYPLGEEGKVTISLAEEGIFKLCIGVKQMNKYLLGDSCTLVVSNDAAPPPRTSSSSSSSSAAYLTAPIRMLPPPPAPMSSSSSNSGPGVACVICQDITVSVLFYPCRHVCVCDGCASALRESRSRLCPICRHEITREEKVFLP